MRRLLVIAQQEVVTQMVDPVILIFMVAVPLLVAALVSAAFGDVVLGQPIPEGRVPVGIVNQDAGSEWGAVGQVYVRAFIPDPQGPALPAELGFDVFSAMEFADEQEARRLVEQGKLVAALIIPADFSERLLSEDAVVAVYINGAEDILGEAFAHAVEAVSDRIATGEVSVRTAVYGLLSDARTRVGLRKGTFNETLSDLAIAAALPDSDIVRVQRLAPPAPSAPVSLGDYLAAAIAVTFAGFIALRVVASLFHEKAEWTLQRVCITPTPLGVVVGGKVLGAYLTGALQVAVLVGALALWRRVLASPGTSINLMGLFALALAVVAAATGTGVLLVGLARTQAEAANYGRAGLILMGVVGGVFFPLGLFPQGLQTVARLTFHYWAMSGYLELARGGTSAAVVPHVATLALMGAVSFAVGARLVRRRMEFG